MDQMATIQHLNYECKYRKMRDQFSLYREIVDTLPCDQYERVDGQLSDMDYLLNNLTRKSNSTSQLVQNNAATIISQQYLSRKRIINQLGTIEMAQTQLAYQDPRQCPM